MATRLWGRCRLVEMSGVTVQTFDISALEDGFERLNRRLTQIANIADYAEPLMLSWRRRMEADNRDGILKGEDKDGNPAPKLKYRPAGKPQKITVAQRLGQHPQLWRGNYAGTGKYSGLLPNNNLSSSEYRKLDGPRLAPRWQFSRVISNYSTGHGRDTSNPNIWYAVGSWIEVVSVKGFHFLPCHFKGEGQYDLRGVRPDGIRNLMDDLREWAKMYIRERYVA